MESTEQQEWTKAAYIAVQLDPANASDDELCIEMSRLVTPDTMSYYCNDGSLMFAIRDCFIGHAGALPQDVVARFNESIHNTNAITTEAVREYASDDDTHFNGCDDIRDVYAIMVRQPLTIYPPIRY